MNSVPRDSELFPLEFEIDSRSAEAAASQGVLEMREKDFWQWVTNGLFVHRRVSRGVPSQLSVVTSVAQQKRLA